RTAASPPEAAVPYSSRCVAKRHKRQGDLECRTLRARFGEDQTACMSFDDRAADRQTQSHTRALSRKERLKYAALVLRVDSRSSVLDGQEHVRIFTEPRANLQSAVANGNGVHGLDRVLDQIQYHLLQLRRIGTHRRGSGQQLGHDRYFVKLQF